MAKNVTKKTTVKTSGGKKGGPSGKDVKPVIAPTDKCKKC